MSDFELSITLDLSGHVGGAKPSPSISIGADRVEPKRDARLCAQGNVISISRWKCFARQAFPPCRSCKCGLSFILVQLGLDRRLDFLVQGAVILEHFLRGIAALSQLRAFVIQPRTALFDDLLFQCNI